MLLSKHLIDRTNRILTPDPCELDVRGYIQHWVDYWLRRYSDKESDAQDRREAVHLLAANWHWAGVEGVRSQIALTDDQRTTLLSVLLEADGAADR